MQRTFASLAVIAAVGLAAFVGCEASWTPPAFCNKLDCPKFTVLASNASTNVEIRSYEPSWWASTNITGMDYDEATTTGFHRLFSYISGANAAGQNIEMAAPVLVDIFPGAGPTCNSTMRVSFFTPFALQGKAPAPTSSDVYLHQRPPQTVAVRHFGGFAKWTDYQQNLETLGNDLTTSGIAFDSTKEITAGYSSPFTIFNRWQEAWLLLE